jgi:uncharacterized protein (TIGR03083 family)
MAGTAARVDVLASLDAVLPQLDDVLSQLNDDSLAGVLPGPLGPMPGRAVMDLALTELTLHRCDVALGLGLPSDIDPTAATAILDVIRAWLLLVAPSSPVPERPLCYVFTDGPDEWTFAFDGDRWGTGPCRPEGAMVTAQGARGQLALALAGRLPVQRAVDHTSGPVELVRFKTFLPGP